MHILLSNDDGYLAEGLRRLAKALGELGELTVVAPDRNRSGASNSLTLDQPLRMITLEDGVIRVDGTPTDCVHLAITGLLEREPDMVVSGINSGPNLGDDVIYSGTVAAAMEGRFLGLPAIAVSMGHYDPEHYDSGVRATLHLVASCHRTPFSTSMSPTCRGRRSRAFARPVSVIAIGPSRSSAPPTPVAEISSGSDQPDRNRMPALALTSMLCAKVMSR